MPRVARWLLTIAGAFAVVALGLYILFRVFVGGVNFAAGGGQLDEGAIQARIKVASPFALSVYARDVANARVLRFTRSGDLLVAQPNLGSILLLRDTDGDGAADQQDPLLTGLNGPNGLDFHQNWLYVALNDAIIRVPFDHAKGHVNGVIEVLVSGLPDGGNHWKKTLRFGPDGLMYVTMGSSCNVCEESDERRAAMVRYSPDGTDETIFARGLRNSAGFAWNDAGELFATDNGRDLLGDNFPPCELNQVVQGGHYGWPYVNGAGLADPDFGPGNEAFVAEALSPVFEFRAHNAPLGIDFLGGAGWPPGYAGAALVALHGSWNRSEKDGYKVVSLHWHADGSIESRDFVSGFLLGDDVIGRPAELAIGPDRAVYIADDYANAVYRVSAGVAAPDAPGLPVLNLSTVTAAQDLEQFDEKQLAAFQVEGAAAFETYACRSCHAGEPGQVLLQDIGSRYDIAGLSAFLRRPTPPMPAHDYEEGTLEALVIFLLTR